MDLATFWSPEKSKSRSNLNIKKSHFNLILFPPPISGGTDWSMIKSSNLLLYPDRFQSNIIKGCNLNSCPQEMRLVDIYPRGNFDRLILFLFIHQRFWSIDLPPMPYLSTKEIPTGHKLANAVCVTQQTENWKYQMQLVFRLLLISPFVSSAVREPPGPQKGLLGPKRVLLGASGVPQRSLKSQNH